MSTFAGASLIVESLEIAAEQGDLTDGVYARLFARFPETEALFSLDRTGAVRGAMLTQTIETILDFIAERRYAHRFIQCEVITREGYSVPREAFAAFFGIVAEEVRSACGPRWTQAIDETWARLLAELDRYVANPDQSAL